MSTSKKILLLLIAFIGLNVFCIVTYVKEYGLPEEETIQIIAEPVEEVSVVEEEPDPKLEDSIEVIKEVPIENTQETPIVTQTEESTIQITAEPEQKEPTLSDEEIQSQINAIVTENGIIFKRLSTDVTAQSLNTIKQIAEILNQNKHINIEIGGHTDAKGDDEVNAYISKHRAISVKKILVGLGVEEERLSAKGYGESQPIVENDPQGYSIKNRRVEFKIVKEE